ncbi:MAG: TRAP transporter fused permease subunit [Desulfobacteraceae bacterium]|nr:TRAP transporter fused permease subunit [Desulfobacteraceae bacterium]
MDKTNNTEKTEIKIVGRYRELKGIYRWYFLGFTALASILSFIHAFKIVLFGYMMPEMSYYAVLIAAFVSFTFLIFPASKKSPRDRVPWYDTLLAVASLLGPIYIFTHNLDILLEGWEVIPPPEAKVLALITWVVIIEAVRRAGGSMLAAVILVVSLYPLFAHLCPGILMAKQYSLSRILGFHFLGMQSIFGLPTQVFCRLLIGYMIFAVTLQITGAADFFINFCLSILGGVRGGAAKVSILSSAFFATMSGSVIANVVTTGAVTIPTMKRLGYPPYYAGAIEACASKGGVLTPPVMGVTAFIMADFIGVSYAEVCVAAALPVFLYWVSLFAQTDFYAAKMGLRGLPKHELPLLWPTLRDGWFYIVALGVLVYIIFMHRMEALAPYYATGVLLVLANFRKETRLNRGTVIRLTDGTGKILTELMGILVGVGMIIGALSLTGTAHGLSGSLTRLGGDNMLLLLIIGAVTSFLLGIGLTISACYIFLAMLLAPTLVSLGIYEMSAHLFLVYWGSVSYITPPVALAAYAAASIAGSDPLKTAVQAVKLGFVSLLVPFFFVYNPALVGHGTALQIIQAMGTATLGIILLSAGFEGYCFFVKRISIPVRILFIAAGFLVFHPKGSTDLIGLGLIILGLVVHYVGKPMVKKREVPPIEATKT